MTEATLARQLVEAHLVGGTAEPGAEIELRVDQVLLHDGTGPLVVLALDAMGTDRVVPGLTAVYFDHLVLQADPRNADDHLLLLSAAERYGFLVSEAGGGISHPVHQQHFGIPGTSLLGADSHTCAAGSLGVLAIGAGGMEAAVALAGEPYRLRMPRVHGVRLTGALPDWVSAKDVVLELLRRHGVAGAAGCILEYHGPGCEALSVLDRHVIANMGAELGATTSVFPSDERTREFLAGQGREGDWRPLHAEPGAAYDVVDHIDLGTLEPLIALPPSPGNVVPVREVEGEEIQQAYIGSSANPGFRDLAVAAHIVDGRHVAPGVSFDVNPASRQVLTQLVRHGLLDKLLAAGARLHQTGCNGCAGMGQSPAPGARSLRTTPRNFRGRSGTPDDAVYLCSPETVAASAVAGVITDPRRLDRPCPRIAEPGAVPGLAGPASRPSSAGHRQRLPLRFGAGHEPLPALEPLPDELVVPVLLCLGDDVSTDEIMPAGVHALSLYSSVGAMSRQAFAGVDPTYAARAEERREAGGHALVAGANYGQGSSREHAALGPRCLGLRVVVARDIARIHHDNLVNYGVLPLFLDLPHDEAHGIEVGAVLELRGLRAALVEEAAIEMRCDGRPMPVRHRLSPRQREVALAGGALNHMRSRLVGVEGDR